MGKHLTYTDRLKLEALNNRHVTKADIAEELGCSIRTVYYELARGRCTKMTTHYEFITTYSADIAQSKMDFNNLSKGAPEKIGTRHDICELLSSWVLSGLSPAVCAAKLRNENWGITLCANTIYNYIRKGYLPGVTMLNCPEGNIRRVRKSKTIPRPRRATAGTSIEKRPTEINKRQEIGHWEMDCVIGKSTGRRQALLTLTERVTRYEIIMRLERKDSASVVRTLDKIEKELGANEFRRLFKSITVDNGSEFADVEGLERSRNGKFRTKVYYCHPYCSSERGSNERHNRIIRRFLPKGQSLWGVTQRDCDKIADWMNDYPRKRLGWATPRQLFMSAFYPEKKVTEQNQNFAICS